MGIDKLKGLNGKKVKKKMRKNKVNAVLTFGAKTMIKCRQFL